MNYKQKEKKEKQFEKNLAKIKRAKSWFVTKLDKEEGRGGGEVMGLF